MRVIAIDYLKGIGIISFIHWHSLNYFLEGHEWSSPIGRFLHYVTGFFVFMSGLVAGIHYLREVPSEIGAKRAMQLRLAIRSGKLIIIFLLGAFAKEVLRGGGSLEDFGKTLYAIGSLFFVDRWDIALQVLCVIAFVLIFCVLLMEFRQRIDKHMLIAASMGVLLSEAVFRIHFSYFWHYLIIGALGCIMGLLVSTNSGRILALLKRMNIRLLFGVVVAVYLIIGGSVALNKSIYYFFLNKVIPNLFSVLANSIFWGFPVFQTCFVMGRRPNAFISQLVLLGRYSLLVYVLQICLLNVIKASDTFQRTGSEIGCGLITLGLLFICYFTCLLVNWMRKASLIDKAYKMIFS